MEELFKIVAELASKKLKKDISPELVKLIHKSQTDLAFETVTNLEDSFSFMGIGRLKLDDDSVDKLAIAEHFINKTNSKEEADKLINDYHHKLNGSKCIKVEFNGHD